MSHLTGQRVAILASNGFEDTPAPEQVAARFDAISDRDGEIVPDMGAAQGMIELTKAQKAHTS